MAVGSDSGEIVLTELRKVFDNCDSSGTAEVEIDLLVNQVCALLPRIENQLNMKLQLFQLLSTSSGSTSVKRDKFEECLLEWIDEVFGRKDDVFLDRCSSSEPYPLRDRLNSFDTSTPKRGNTFKFEDTFFNSRDELILDNEEYTSQNVSMNSPTVSKEDVLALKQVNGKLNATISNLRSQISLFENSPCKNCRILESNIDELKRTHKQVTEENNRHCEELSDELVRCQAENVKYKHKIAFNKKTEETLQTTIDDLQSQMSELNEILLKEQQTAEECKKALLEMEKDKIEINMYLENIEKKLMIMSAENECLKKDIINLEEYISSQRNKLKMPLDFQEEVCSSLFSPVLADNNLMQELSNEVPRYGFTDAFTQSLVTLCNSVAVQVRPQVMERQVQTSVATRNQKVQTLFISSQAISSQTTFANNEMLPQSSNEEVSSLSAISQINGVLDELQDVVEKEESSIHTLQNYVEKRKKIKKKSGLIFLCCCLVVVPLMIASFVYLSRDHSYQEFFCDFKVKLVYLYPPPV